MLKPDLRGKCNTTVYSGKIEAQVPLPEEDDSGAPHLLMISHPVVIETAHLKDDEKSPKASLFCVPKKTIMQEMCPEVDRSWCHPMPNSKKGTYDDGHF